MEQHSANIWVQHVSKTPGVSQICVACLGMTGEENKSSTGKPADDEAAADALAVCEKQVHLVCPAVEIMFER